MKHEDGIRTDLVHKELPFQFDFGIVYTVRMTLDAQSVDVQVSNGVRTEAISAPLSGFTFPIDQVFFTDIEGGVSLAAGPGDYVLRFDNVLVTSP